MENAFGKSLLIDLYDCEANLDDLELIYRFLEELVVRLGMQAFSPAIVFHGPKDKNGNEIYPDKAGVSGVVFLITSSIVIHTIIPNKFVSIDVYSCNDFNINETREYIKSVFKSSRLDEEVVIRGKQYKS